MQARSCWKFYISPPESFLPLSGNIYLIAFEYWVSSCLFLHLITREIITLISPWARKTKLVIGISNGEIIFQCNLYLIKIVPL